MYTLGSITLPNPKKFERKIIEMAAEHLLMFGRTTKRLQHRKEQFVLTYQYLTKAQVNTILSQFQLNSPLTFAVDETNLVIPATEVLMDIGKREYADSGFDYTENLDIVLTEVF